MAGVRGVEGSGGKVNGGEWSKGVEGWRSGMFRDNCTYGREIQPAIRHVYR